MRESEFIVRPEHFLRYLRESLGLRRAETHLPRIGVIVFTSGDFQALHRTVHGQRKGWNRWLSVGTAGMRSVVVARSPIGAPAAIVTMEEMAALGCRTFLTFGACGSLVPDLVIGDLVLPTFAISDEGTSRLYGKARALRPDGNLRGAIATVLESRSRRFRPGGTWTIDAVYRESRARARQLVARGVVAVEMEAAALWAVARHRGVRAASLFVVSDELGGREWNPGFEDPRFLTGKRRARRLLIDVISRGEA
ncbi:MAG: hypothetical protein E6K05_08410 [Methanobacteriota archaeon]|nr:MAG: hypothetical protein E6K05_08410 [Euryarchaeota archaeon]